MSIYFYFYEDELLYIGSSMNMKRRIKEHKSRLKCGSNIPFYNYLRENNLTFDTIELEDVKTEVTYKEQLRLLEGKCIMLYKPICNVETSGHTYEEWYEENKVRLIQKQNQYY